MKKTALYNIHVGLNAKITSFGGYLMPIQYSTVKKEHLTVRNNLGVFDVSHMGEFFISGDNAINLLQYICSNDISKIKIGKAQYNYFPNHKGGIIDDLIVYRLEENKFMLVVNASNIEKDWDWITINNKNFNAEIVDRSNEISLLAIQGPKSIEAMQSLTKFKLDSLPYYSQTTTIFAGCQNVIVATTGYTGSGGIEIYFNQKDSEKIWNSVIEAGKPFKIEPIGLAARDTLRIEMGYCLYGNEINENTSPVAAGLGWISKPEKKCINHEDIFLQKSEGTNKKLIGFIMDEKAIPRSGYQIVNKEKNIIGKVTSGTQSPSLVKGIGLGYVEKSYSNLNTQIGIIIRNKICYARVIKIPFIK